jgi:beta-glucosidase
VPGARIGAVVNLSPCEPASDDPADVAAARRADGHTNRWWLDPLYGRGYPADMVEAYGVQPPVRDGDLAAIAAPTDHIGLNYYFRQVVTDDPDGPLPHARMVPVPHSLRTDMDWEVHPDGLEQLLTRLAEDYRVPRVFVTESGSAWPDEVVDGMVADLERADYLESHIAAGGPLGRARGTAGRILRLVPVGQLRVVVRVREAVRAGARRLRDPGPDDEGQRPALRQADRGAARPEHRRRVGHHRPGSPAA